MLTWMTAQITWEPASFFRGRPRLRRPFFGGGPTRPGLRARRPAAMLRCLLGGSTVQPALRSKSIASSSSTTSPSFGAPSHIVKSPLRSLETAHYMISNQCSGDCFRMLMIETRATVNAERDSRSQARKSPGTTKKKPRLTRGFPMTGSSSKEEITHAERPVTMWT